MTAQHSQDVWRGNHVLQDGPGSRGSSEFEQYKFADYTVFGADKNIAFLFFPSDLVSDAKPACGISRRLSLNLSFHIHIHSVPGPGPGNLGRARLRRRKRRRLQVPQDPRLGTLPDAEHGQGRARGGVRGQQLRRQQPPRLKGGIRSVIPEIQSLSDNTIICKVFNSLRCPVSYHPIGHVLPNLIILQHKIYRYVKNVES